jgi:hypothetical protein
LPHSLVVAAINSLQLFCAKCFHKAGEFSRLFFQAFFHFRICEIAVGIEQLGDAGQ